MADKLTMAALEAYHGQGRKEPTGGRLRFACPLHGGDNPTSLSVDPKTGWYRCFACGATGQLEEYRQEWLERQKELRRAGGTRREPPTYWPQAAPPPQADPHRAELLAGYQANLTPDSPGARYLAQRGISLELARRYGLGYAPPWKWAGRARKWERLVVPHLDPGGAVVNLYGRAMAGNEQVPKGERHDHLPGAKGAFNAPQLLGDVVFLTEGAMDALALLVSGAESAVAMLGPDSNVSLGWLQARRVVLCLDQDDTGTRATGELAEALTLLGVRVFTLPADVYRGQKDLNEALQAGGRLDLGAVLAELEEDQLREAAEASPAEPEEPGEPLPPWEPEAPMEPEEPREPETSALYNQKIKEHEAGCLQCTCRQQRPCPVGSALRERYWELRKEEELAGR